MWGKIQSNTLLVGIYSNIEGVQKADENMV